LSKKYVGGSCSSWSQAGCCSVVWDSRGIRYWWSLH